MDFVKKQVKKVTGDKKEEKKDPKAAASTEKGGDKGLLGKLKK